MSNDQSFGQALPDQFERLTGYFDVHLQTLGDVRELYQSRVALEREYATKLKALARRAIEKKEASVASLIVGNEPTKAWNDALLQQHTLTTAYTELMDSLISTAQDHVNLADTLSTQVVDVLKTVEKGNEETKRKVNPYKHEVVQPAHQASEQELAFFQKLLAGRDHAYNDRAKSKQKYDEDCMEAEAARQKTGRAQDDRHADRAAKQAENQRTDMLNSKNTYLLSIAVANAVKGQFYTGGLPELEDQFQRLQTRLVQRFVKIVQHSQKIELSHLEAIKHHVNRVQGALERVDTTKDQGIYIQYNIRAFSVPNDWAFEPCQYHYDSSEMNVDPSPKVFLQNRLARAGSKLAELKAEKATKRRELDQLSTRITSYAPDHTLGNIDEMSDNFLEAHHQVALLDITEVSLRSEAETIVTAIGNDQGSQRPHQFKSSTFSIPTTCEYCKTSLWGLTKSGKTCKLCGISVHTKCELKIPADCEKADPVARTSSLLSAPPTRTVSRVSTSSQSTAPSVASQDLGDTLPTATMLFDFAATSAFELTASEGENVKLLEPDDGSGWVKIVNEHGQDGLVPASYIELVTNAPMAPIRMPVAAPAPAGIRPSRQYVRAIYTYEPQGPDELALVEGEKIELTTGPNGGKSFGDGWWEGVDSKGKKGIFPSNYVEEV